MSTETTADTGKSALLDNLKEMIATGDLSDELINKMVDPETWGADGWTDEFRTSIDELRKYLLVMRQYFREFRRRYGRYT